MKQTEEELLNTMYIKDIVNEYNEDQSEEKYMMLFGQLMLRMAEGGKAPMPLMNITRITLDLDGETDTKDFFPDLDESDLFMRVKGNNGKYWIPLFTDRYEIGDVCKTNAVKEVPIRDIIKMAHSDSELNGVLINPQTQGFTLSQDFLALMLEQEERYKQAWEDKLRLPDDSEEG